MNVLAQAAIERFLSRDPEEIRKDLAQAVRYLPDERFRAIMDVVLSEIDRRWPK